MRFGAKGLMSTLMRVRISSDAPRCTVQFGALDPRCTMVQVHGDPKEPSLGAGAAGAPCVTLPRCYAVQVEEIDAEWKEEAERAEAEAATAGQSVGLQEEDPLRSAGGLDPLGQLRD